MTQRRLLHILQTIRSSVMIVRVKRYLNRLRASNYLASWANVSGNGELTKKHTHHRKQCCN
ncbi:hypothetical protein EGT07_24885 [Herbaspirillum sp. HC18]|nr:hypothetical protein EGT07_24885 [Herbaspirillum sp. HC18]